LPIIGVLALQGAYAEHLAALRKLEVEAREIRLPGALDELDGLIIPGGESTTIAKLMDAYGLREPLKQRVKGGMAVWGTCAGLILLANKLVEDRLEPLALMDMEVHRNAYGRQVDSFETDVTVPALGEPPFHAIFIRAPKIRTVGEKVEVLGEIPEGAVAARENGILVTAFHPELTNDTRFHEYFLRMAAQCQT